MSSIEKGGPAEKAGLKEGDVILGFDGQAIDSAGQLPSAIAATDPGKAVKLQVWRDRSAREFAVKLGQVTEESVASNDDGAGSGRLGMQVRPLSPEEKQQSELIRLLVEDVDGAATMHAYAGDIVIAADGTPVKSVEQLRSVVSGARNHVALLVQRGTTHGCSSPSTSVDAARGNGRADWIRPFPTLATSQPSATARTGPSRPARAAPAARGPG